jgi:hypothetical protein
MSLGDIMGAADLTSWAEMALLISFATFGALVLLVTLRRGDRTWERARYLPLDDPGPAGSTTGTPPGSSKASSPMSPGAVTGRRPT